MDFKLHAPYEPTGDQPEAIRQLVDGVRSGYKHQVLLGATGTGKTFTIANVIAQTKLPALVMAHNKTLAAQLYAEFKEFFQKTRWSILSPITIITSLKLMFHSATFTSKRNRNQRGD